MENQSTTNLKFYNEEYQCGIARLDVSKPSSDISWDSVALLSALTTKGETGKTRF